MFALAFDMNVARTAANHPTGNATSAYGDIRRALEVRGFEWTQGSLYILRNEDMSILFVAIQDLIRLPWFPSSVTDIRAFRVEQWSDFTAMVKAQTGIQPAPPAPRLPGPQGQLPLVPSRAPNDPGDSS